MRQIYVAYELSLANKPESNKPLSTAGPYSSQKWHVAAVFSPLISSSESCSGPLYVGIFEYGPVSPWKLQAAWFAFDFDFSLALVLDRGH
jgi:hypothetical protein